MTAIPTPPPARPPDRVDFTDPETQRHLAQLDPGHVLVGVDAQHRPVTIGPDSGHVLVTAGCGQGATTMLRLIAAQAARNGVEVHIADSRRRAHQWAHNLPGVEVWRDPSEIHGGLVAIAAAARQVAERLDDGTDDSETGPPGRRHVVVIDEATATLRALRDHRDTRPRPGRGHIVLDGELVEVQVVIEEGHATIRRLQQWWQKIRQPGVHVDAPSTPRDGVEAFQELLYMGRSAGISVVIAAPPGAARGPGPELRAQFTTQVALSGRPAGRAEVTDHCHHSADAQTIWITEPDAHDWAATSPAPAPGRNGDTPRRPAHACLDHLDRVGVVGLTHECVVCGRLYDHLDIDDMTNARHASRPAADENGDTRDRPHQ